MRKKLSVLLMGVLCFVMVFSLICDVKADYVTYSNIGYYSYLDAAGTAGSAVEFSVAGDDSYLVSVTFWVANKSVAETGQLRAVLYDGFPSNTSLEVSITGMDFSLVDDCHTATPSSLASFTSVSFTFSGETQLVSGHTYSLGVFVFTALSGGMQVACSQSGTKYYRNMYGDAYASDTGLPLYIWSGYVSPTASSSPSSSPVATPYNDGGFWEYSGTALNSGVIQLFLALVICVGIPLMVLVGFPKLGALGFMVLMSACVVLGVFFLNLPFYMLVVVGLGIALMFITMAQRMG